MWSRPEILPSTVSLNDTLLSREISEELSDVEKLFSDILTILFWKFLFLFAVSLDFYMLGAIV